MSTVDKSLFSTSSPDVVWDYVVIGSGMGGMTTASLLAKLGKRVLVLEQHYVPGGFTHTFRRKKWAWDVGVHAVGEVDENAILGRVLDKLGSGRLEWTSLGGVYDEFHFPDLRIDFPNSKQAFVANLEAAFPTQRRAITDYLNKAKEVSGAMRSYYLSRVVPPSWAAIADPLLARKAHHALTQTTQSVLDGMSSDERLKSVLTAQWGYYGVPPARSSFAIHALVARHFVHGGFYPKGGAARIAESLLSTVANAGGWTRIRADVAEILVENGRAVGVRLRDGEEIRAKRVVSAAGALPTVERLLPASERNKPWVDSIRRLKPSPCHVCLYIGFRGDIRTAGATAANKWFYETWSKDAVHWDVSHGAAEAPILYTSFPSLKDPNHDAGPAAPYGRSGDFRSLRVLCGLERRPLAPSRGGLRSAQNDPVGAAPRSAVPSHAGPALDGGLHRAVDAFIDGAFHAQRTGQHLRARACPRALSDARAAATDAVARPVSERRRYGVGGSHGRHGRRRAERRRCRAALSATFPALGHPGLVRDPRGSGPGRASVLHREPGRLGAQKFRNFPSPRLCVSLSDHVRDVATIAVAALRGGYGRGRLFPAPVERHMFRRRDGARWWPRRREISRWDR